MFSFISLVLGLVEAIYIPDLKDVKPDTKGDSTRWLQGARGSARRFWVLFYNAPSFLVFYASMLQGLYRDAVSSENFTQHLFSTDQQQAVLILYAQECSSPRPLASSCERDKSCESLIIIWATSRLALEHMTSFWGWVVWSECFFEHGTVWV